jgi:hypothetical protein
MEKSIQYLGTVMGLVTRCWNLDVISLKDVSYNSITVLVLLLDSTVQY